MSKFLEEVIEKSLQEFEDTPTKDLIYIVPNKRAVVFLKKYFSQIYKKPCISPKFTSLGEFIENMSGYTMMPEISLIFELYKSYREVEKNADSLEQFLLWGKTLITDFNEIDQYLVDTKKIFPYIKAIKEIESWDVEHWSNGKLTKQQEEYLKFWNSLGDYYRQFNKNMHNLRQGYRGFVYRYAVEEVLSKYVEKSQEKVHIFAGFNVLTKAEEKIILEILLKNTNARIFWDAPSSVMNYEAGSYIKKYTTQWSYYSLSSRVPLKLSSENENKPNIKIYGVAKDVNQAHLACKILSKEQKNENTGLILAKEDLLIPVLEALDTQSPVNITMGLPLNLMPANHLFDTFLKLQTTRSWYHKDVVSLLSQPLLRNLFSKNYIPLQLELIKEKNWVFLSKKQLLENYNSSQVQNVDRFKGRATEKDKELIDILFSDRELTVEEIIDNCFGLIDLLAQEVKKNKPENSIEGECLYHYFTVFNIIETMQKKYHFIDSVKALYMLFLEAVAKEKLDFRGEPLQGIQIMGMLESQNLNFKNIIITSVNEGVVPSGKTSNSFIPYDVKKELGLPTYKQRDAIFSYHFHRLVASAENVTLIYNTESDGINSGEKSRFIMQILAQKNYNCGLGLENEEKIEKIISPKLETKGISPIVIRKSDKTIEKLKKLATESGFSPTSLTTYVKNPIDFYRQYVLSARQEEEVEETVEARTFGKIMHGVLEDLYTPLKNKKLRVEDVEQMREKISSLVKKHFCQNYRDDEKLEGKNLLIESVIVEYLNRFLEIEKKNIEQEQYIEILELEKKIYLDVEMNLGGEKIKIRLKGTADRIEKRGGDIYIIDYKTGDVDESSLKIDSKKLEDSYLVEDFKYSKAFQLLFYGYVVREQNLFQGEGIYVGNYSFRKLKFGFMPLKIGSGRASAWEKANIDRPLCDFFEQNLKKILEEIFDKEVDFVEKQE